MTEDIIKMAQEAGFAMAWMSHEEHQCIERLVSMAKAAEREACAMVCDALWIEEGYDADAVACAVAIRARGEAC